MRRALSAIGLLVVILGLVIGIDARHHARLRALQPVETCAHPVDPPIAVYHRDHVAFFTSCRWSPGETALARQVVYPDGSRPAPNTLVFCGTCRQQVQFFELTFTAPGKTEAGR